MNQTRKANEPLSAAPLRPRSALALALSSLLLLTLSPLGAAAATPNPAPFEGAEETLGVPISGDVATPSSAITTNADGRPIAATVVTGEVSVFSAVDALTGELLFSQDVPGVSQAWAYETASDRRVYIGAGGGFTFVFDPDLLTLVQIGGRLHNQGTWWDADQTPDGRVWYGTQPGGGIIGWDPATEQWGDYISFSDMHDNVTNVRSVATWDGKVFAGTGTYASIFEYDPATESRTEIPLPAGFENQKYVYDLSIAGDRMFARLSPSSTLLVYDLVDREWVNTIPAVLGSGMPAAREVTVNGERRSVTYFIAKSPGTLMEYDLDSDTYTPTSKTITQSVVGNFGWVDVPVNGETHEVLLVMDRLGHIHQWDATADTSDYYPADVVPTGAQIRSLAAGPDNAIYSAGYASNAGISRYDVETGDVQMLVGPGQIEQFGVIGSHLLFGVYEGAEIFDWDTSEPWDWKNTVRRWKIGDKQDRPTSIIDAGGLVAIGSVPQSGQLGGALTLLDRDTGTMETFRNVVPNQSPLALVYLDGKIYGGTGVHGGIGTTPTASTAELFVFDVATRTVEKRIVPVPGNQKNISGLTVDDIGTIWGVTGSHVFAFDPSSQQVTYSKKIIDINDNEAYWVGRSLSWHDGMLVGQTSRRAFVFDPVSEVYTELSSLGTKYAAGVAIDAQGRFYYSENSTLRRFTPSATQACTRQLDRVVAGSLSIGGDEVVCGTDTTIRGTVVVNEGGALKLDHSTVSGSIMANRASTVHIVGSTISGAVSMTNTTGPLVFSDNELRGSLSCSGSDLDDRGRPNVITGAVDCSLQ